MTNELPARPSLLNSLERIAAGLERLSPPPAPAPTFEEAEAYVWAAAEGVFEPVRHVNRVPLALLRGIDHVAGLLLANTLNYARGHAANNALLWGARGMGKSSLVKAVHREAATRVAGEPSAKAGADQPHLVLVEIHREDIASLPRALAHLRRSRHRFIVFCDDLSFDRDDTSYKSLKAVLEGGLEGRPANMLFYATSNRRHLMPREMADNERATAINPGEAVEEMVSLSDRFGLWLGFHSCSQDDYLAMVRAYAGHHGLACDKASLDREALEWSITRGARSGRVAWQFIQDLAGRQGRSLD